MYLCNWAVSPPVPLKISTHKRSDKECPLTLMVKAVEKDVSRLMGRLILQKGANEGLEKGEGSSGSQELFCGHC